MSKKVVICGVDTSSLPKLTSVQSRQYLELIANGDMQARSYFISANFRLVLSIVHRYAKRVANVDDLFQIGCVGLIKSVDNFDIKQNVAFSTYAVPMIIGEVRRFIRESNSLRVSRGIRDVAYMALKAREELELATSEDVSVEQIAEHIHLPVFRVVYCLDAISEPVSLSDKVYNSDDDNFTLLDQLQDPRQCESIWTDNVSLSQALSQLDDRERDIVIKRYYQDKTQVEVSQDVGISQAQVSRLEKNAVSHLRISMS